MGYWGWTIRYIRHNGGYKDVRLHTETIISRIENEATMKKPLLFFLVLLFWGLGYSQSVSPQVTASAGEHFSGTNAQLSWTIGETMIETYVNGSNQLTQGFHQTNLMITAVNDLAESFQVKVFPNPATDVLNIEWSEITDPLNLNLFDATGKQLLLQKALDQTMPKTLDLSGYATGNYLLHLSNSDGETLKIFKILKIK